MRSNRRQFWHWRSRHKTEHTTERVGIALDFGRRSAGAPSTARFWRDGVERFTACDNWLVSGSALSAEKCHYGSKTARTAHFYQLGVVGPADFYAGASPGVGRNQAPTRLLV